MTGWVASIGSLAEVVTNGLCSGCGLCAAIAGPVHVKMVLTPEGRERPLELRPLSGATFDAIRAVRPGTLIEGLPAARSDAGARIDAIWGPYRRIDRGSSADPEIRFKGSSGGVLTTLALHFVESARVAFVLHVGADPERPMCSRWRLSNPGRTRVETRDGGVFEATYGEVWADERARATSSAARSARTRSARRRTSWPSTSGRASRRTVTTRAATAS